MKPINNELTNREKYDLSVLATIFFFFFSVICISEFDSDGAIILIVFALISALSSMHYFLKSETENKHE